MAADTARTIPVGVTIEGRDESGPAVRALRRLGVGAKSAAVSIRGLREVTSGLFRGIGMSVAGLGAAGAGLALATKQVFGFVDAWATSADERAKFRRQIRATVADLEAWEYAASREGVGVETLRSSLVGLDKAAGMLAMRRGRGYAILSGIVGGKDLIARLKAAPDTVAQLRIALDALRKAAPQYRGAIAAALGLDPGMLRLADASEAAIDRLLEQRRRYGLTSESGSAAAEAWKDALDDLRAAWEGLKSLAVPELISVALPQIRSFTEWLAANRGKLSGFVAEWGKKVIEAASGAAEALKAIVGGLETIDRYRRAWGGEKKAEKGVPVFRGHFGTRAAEAQQRIQELMASGYVSRADLDEAQKLARRDWADPAAQVVAVMERLQRTAAIRGAVTIQVSAAPGTKAEVSRVDGEGVEVAPFGTIPLLGGVP